MSVNVSNAYKYFGGAEGGGGGLQPEDFHELVMTGGYSGGAVTRRYNVFEGLNMVVGNLFFTKRSRLFEVYNPLNEDNVSVDITEDSVMFSTSNTWAEVLDSANMQIPMFLRTGGEGPSDPEKIFTYVGLFTFDDGGVDKSGAMFYRLNTDLTNFEVWIIDEDDGWSYQTIDFGSANIIDTTAAGLDWANPDPDVCAEVFSQIGSLLARGIIPVLQVDGQPNKKYAYFVGDGMGYHFIGQWGAIDSVDYIKYYITPSNASIDNTTLHQYLRFDTLTTQDFDFSTPNVASCSKLLKNNTMYILTDWDGTWGIRDTIQFHCEKTDPKNICIKLKQCDVHPDGAWNIAVDTSDSVQLQNANDQQGAIDHLVKGNSYNIFVSDYEWLAEEFVDIDPSMIVTDQELRDALDTLKSRTVFVLDVGSIGGLQAAHPNGNGFIGTLFSPVMDFDLSTNTKVIFDVEQTSSLASDMENFVLAIYEYDKGDSQLSIPPSFKWVCNTNDLATELYNNGSPTTGIKKASLYSIRNDKKLYGGKLYYAIFAGKWNGWGFAGSSSPVNMHSDIMIAPTCDNRNNAIGGNIGTVYPSIALAPTGSQDDFYTETQGSSRLFMALTNVQLS